MPTWWEVSDSVENFKITWVQFPILCIRKVRTLTFSSSVSFPCSLSKCPVNIGAVSENMVGEIAWVTEQKKDRTIGCHPWLVEVLKLMKYFFGNRALHCSKNIPKWAWFYGFPVWLWRQSMIVEFFRTFVNISHHCPSGAPKCHL